MPLLNLSILRHHPPVHRFEEIRYHLTSYRKLVLNIKVDFSIFV